MLGSDIGTDVCVCISVCVCMPLKYTEYQVYTCRNYTADLWECFLPIYIYLERERERERKKEKEKERERETERERADFWEYFFIRSRARIVAGGWYHHCDGSRG